MDHYMDERPMNKPEGLDQPKRSTMSGIAVRLPQAGELARKPENHHALQQEFEMLAITSRRAYDLLTRIDGNEVPVDPKRDEVRPRMSLAHLLQNGPEELRCIRCRIEETLSQIENILF